MDPYSNYRNINNIDQQIYLQNQQIYLQNQYCYPFHFQQNLPSYNNYCYNVPAVYPLIRTNTNINLPNNQFNLQNTDNSPAVYPLIRIPININLPTNQFILQNPNNVSSNNSKLDQQKEENILKHISILNEKNKKLFKCDLCDYKSIRKGCLKTHLMLIHNVGDIKWFSCNHCNYKTKVKASLTKHEMQIGRAHV